MMKPKEETFFLNLVMNDSDCDEITAEVEVIFFIVENIFMLKLKCKRVKVLD